MKLSLILYIAGVICYILGIIIIVIGTVGFVFAALSGNISDAFESFLLNIVISVIIMMVGELLMIFGRYKLLIELMPADRRGLLKAAVIISILILISGILIVPFLFTEISGAFKDVDEEIEEEDIQRYATDVAVTSKISYGL